MSEDNLRAAAGKIALGQRYTKTVQVQSRLDETLSGSITFALPNGKDLARMGILQMDLREGRELQSFDMLTGGLIVAMSTLAVVVKDAPDWWYRVEGTTKVAAPELLVDQKLLWDIWGEYVAFRDSFPGRGNDLEGGEPSIGATPVQAREEAGAIAVQ